MSQPAGETWLLDLGNSRAKLARLDGSQPGAVAALAWDRPDFETALRGVVAPWPTPQRILIASVTGVDNSGRVRALLPEGPQEWLRTPRRACGVGNRYAKPERLGIDRFLSMVAVRARTPGAGIVIGCGTALTLDAVGDDGEHAAGLIAASPARMLEALHSDTAIADTNPDAFAAAAGGDDTAAALQAGCWAAAGALVEWFAARQRKELGLAPVWLHGGWAEALSAWLARDGLQAEVLQHAALHGLAVWARHLPG